MSHLRTARMLAAAGTILSVCIPSLALGEPSKATPAASALPAAATASAQPAAPAPVVKKSTESIGSSKPAEQKTPDAVALHQALVVIEQNKHPVATGFILSGDGRILSALTPIGSGNGLTGRYADGTTKPLRVAASHRGLNVALLSPDDTRFVQGLRASRLAADDPAAHARWLRSSPQQALTPLAPLRREALVGGDDFALRDVFLATSFGPRPADLGSVLIDMNGDVLGLVAQACQPQAKGECRKVPYVVPVGELKEFLKTVPASAVSPAPWVGIRVADNESCPAQGVRITAIDSRGPLAALGLRVGKDHQSSDVLVAVDGVAIPSTKAFEEILRRHRVGDRVRLLVVSDGHYRELTAVLGSEPQRLANTTAPRNADVGY